MATLNLTVSRTQFDGFSDDEKYQLLQALIDQLNGGSDQSAAIIAGVAARFAELATKMDGVVMTPENKARLASLEKQIQNLEAELSLEEDHKRLARLTFLYPAPAAVEAIRSRIKQGELQALISERDEFRKKLSR